METVLRKALRSRAGGKCEYCHLPERLATLRFQQDHVIPRKHQGGDSIENLAWSCAECNAHKGSDVAGIDSSTGRIERLFNPRTDLWRQHFEWNGPVLRAKSATTRVTIALLQMNREERVALRRELMMSGLYA